MDYPKMINPKQYDSIWDEVLPLELEKTFAKKF